MKKNVTYNYKVKLEKESGDPINSECECPAGKGPHSTCKHVAPVLLVLKEFSLLGNLQIKKTCTEQLQTFNKPRNPFKGSPIQADNIKTTRAPESLHDPRPEKYKGRTGYNQFNDHVRNVMINYSATTSQDLALRYIFPRANIQAAVIDVMDHDYLQIPFTEYWVNSALEVEDAEIFEKSTRGQTSNKRWFNERRWGLTASRFGEILRITNRRNIENLCESLTSCKPLETPATRHGKIMKEKLCMPLKTK